MPDRAVFLFSLLSSLFSSCLASGVWRLASGVCGGVCFCTGDMSTVGWMIFRFGF